MNVIEFGIGETGTGNVIVLTDVIAPEVTVIVVVLIEEKGEGDGRAGWSVGVKFLEDTGILLGVDGPDSNDD